MSKKNAKTTTKAPKTAKGKQQVEAPAAPAPEVPVVTTPVAEAPTKTAKAARKPKKLSAIDAAAQVLAAKGDPMTAPELIEAMAAQGLWSSPKGKTPAATLYASMLREITTKGKASRFSRPARGKFAATGKT
jgi:hypothetical protein